MPVVARWGRRTVLLLLVGWSLLLTVRCHLPRQATAPSPDSTSAVYVVRHGWHAGVAFRRTDVPEDAWPDLSPVPETRYTEIGWGEGRWYPGTSRGLWGLLRAGAWPTASVVHVVPVREPLPVRFNRSTIIRVPVSAEELAALTTYVAKSFSVRKPGRARPAASGYYPDSHFFHSGLPYHLFNNCNHWTAGALEAAGCDNSPRWTFRVTQVLNQARRCGTVVQSGSGD